MTAERGVLGNGIKGWGRRKEVESWRTTRYRLERRVMEL